MDAKLTATVLRHLKPAVLPALLSGLLLSACGQEVSNHVEVNLSAPGIHCNGCVETLESTLRKMPGVDSVKADLEKKTVLAVVDTTLSSQSSLRSMIERLGFSEPIP